MDKTRTAMLPGRISIRFAILDDLGSLERSYALPTAIVRRKIEWQEIIIAELKGGLVGYLCLEYLWSHIPYIALIRVSPEHRRQGIGKALLSFAEEFLREQGHKTLYSSSQVNEAEPQAWHRHVGFEECGAIAGINQGGIGEVFFRKPL